MSPPLGRGYVPIDEGEAEAQEPQPVLTITVVERDGDHAVVRFEIDAAWSRRRSVLDGLLVARAVEYLQREGLLATAQPVIEWSEDGTHRRATYTVEVD